MTSGAQTSAWNTDVNAPRASSLLQKFPLHAPRPFVERADGIYIFTDDGRCLMDATAGATSYAVLGYSHPEVLEAMRIQMARFCHIDYNVWRNNTLEELADLLLSQAPEGLNRVYFSGNSGSEAIEAATKISFQAHYDAGNTEKSWFISREQSFHGATLQGVALSDLPILKFFGQTLPVNNARIPQHNPLHFRQPNESADDYARRGATELEAKILEIGPERVCAFIGETLLGQLVGDVPPEPRYWEYIREVCDRYNVHLILDEIYCGNGRTGKIYCCSWDGITPDFMCLGKPLAGGYAPLSAVITKSKFEDIIAQGQGRIQHGHTHQGHSLGAAAALAVQKVIHRPETLGHILKIGERMRKHLSDRLSEYPFYREVRGRGLLFSLEYDMPRNQEFGLKIAEVMEREHNILINAKWHRVSFAPPYIITEKEADQVVGKVVETILGIAKDWS